MWRKAESLLESLTRSHARLSIADTPAGRPLEFEVGGVYLVGTLSEYRVCTLKRINHLSDYALRVVVHTSEGVHEDAIDPNTITAAQRIDSKTIVEHLAFLNKLQTSGEVTSCI